MFDATPETVITSLNAAIAAPTNIELHLQGGASDASVNRLLARYYQKQDIFPDIRFITRYVAMRMASSMDPSQVLRFSRAFEVNPSKKR